MHFCVRYSMHQCLNRGSKTIMSRANQSVWKYCQYTMSKWRYLQWRLESSDLWLFGHIIYWSNMWPWIINASIQRKSALDCLDWWWTRHSNPNWRAGVSFQNGTSHWFTIGDQCWFEFTRSFGNFACCRTRTCQCSSWRPRKGKCYAVRFTHGPSSMDKSMKQFSIDHIHILTHFFYINLKNLLAGQDVLNDNNWHTVRFSRKASNLRLQVDGVAPVRGTLCMYRQHIFALYVSWRVVFNF